MKKRIKKAVLISIALLVVLVGSIAVILTCYRRPDRTPPSDPIAVELAVQEAGFYEKAPPRYWYLDTRDVTKPQLSFGLNSIEANQKLLFISNNVGSPQDVLSQFENAPFFVEYSDCSWSESLRGTQRLGKNDYPWLLLHCQKPGAGKAKWLLLTSFPSRKAGDSILVVGQAYDDEGKRQYNYKTTLFVLSEISMDETGIPSIK